MLITSTVEVCTQQLGRVEEMVSLPYDAGLSAAAETLVGILKRVIVISAIYPCFHEFLHVDIVFMVRVRVRLGSVLILNYWSYIDTFIH